jgi:Type III restriction enzyme, res subunit
LIFHFHIGHCDILVTILEPRVLTRLSILKINYCSAPCGSGKTYQLIERACQLAAKDECVLVLQPTKQLIDKTVEQELLTKSTRPAFFKFYTESGDSKSVGGRLKEHFRQAPDQGQIAFATHQVLPFIPFWANKSQWHVFVDEELQVVKHNCSNLPDTHRLITDYLDLEPHDAVYSRVVVTDPEGLAAIARNEDEDDIYESLRETAQVLSNNNWASFVNTEQFIKLKAAQAKQLSIHSILSPWILAGCGSVTMASANFPDTLIYRLWGKMGVEFDEDVRLSQGLQFQQHSNGHLITIKYATDLSWSKYLQGRKERPDDKNGGSVLDEVIEAAKMELQDAPFLWQANKSLTTTPFGSNAQRLPNIPHGLNDYSNFDRICFLSALNPAPDHYRFLASRGLRNEEVQRAIYCSTVYQSVMRTSIRDPHNENTKTIIVPDRIAAEYLTELFPGSRIEKLPTKISESIAKPNCGRPRIHKSNRDKNAAHRSRKRLQQLQNVVKNREVRPYSSKTVVGDSKKTCDESTIDIEGSFVTTFSNETYGTIYETKYAQNPLLLPE